MKTYSILEFGAREDTLSTKAVQAAIDAAFLAGGGEVTVPSGSFLIGGIRLRSNVTLHLLEDAVLLGSTDPEDYVGYIEDSIEPIPESVRSLCVPTVNVPIPLTRPSVYPYARWNNAIIRAIHAENLAIIGERGSRICGQNCFDEQGEEGYRGPHAINMWFCRNVTLRGYTVEDSANWAHAIQNSQNITVSHLTVLAGHDGLDFRSCDHILVEHCRLLTGDDCIAGFDNIDVVVRDCYFESACSMMRFGASDMLVENCEGVAPATYGFRGSLSKEEKRARAATHEACRHSCHNVFLYYCDDRAKIRRTPGNIVIRNSRFQGPDSVMRLPFGHKWCCNRSLRDITFENCTVEGVSIPITLSCPEEEKLSFVMRNCTVTPREGFEDLPFLQGENVGKIELHKVSLAGFSAPEICCPGAEVVIEA